MTVLLVDDDVDDKDIFREAVGIAKPDCQLLWAASGVDGIELLKSLDRLPDVIFLDLNMPKMDGKEFLSCIKADPTLQSITVVIYTTANQKSEMGEYFRMGASNYITKPSEFNVLITFLKSLLH